MTGRVPPRQIEAEQSLLGGIMIDGSGLPAALEMLQGDEFFDMRHKAVFRAIQRMSERNVPVDLVTVMEELDRRKELEAAGGLAYLAGLTESVPSAAHVETYASIIADKALLRRIITTADTVSGMCYEGAKPIDQIIDECGAAWFSAIEKRVTNGFTPVSDVLKITIKTIDRLQDRRDGVSWVASHFTDLDSLTCGFQPSDLIIIAARPSMGKTASALCMARNAAIEDGVPVGFFPLEMSKEQLAMRLVCSEAKVDTQKIRTGFVSQNDVAALLTAAGRFQDARIFIDDTPALSVLELRAKARRMMSEKGLGMVVVDYLQLMKGSQGASNREQEISDISSGLKALAKELEIPVIALSQLNRKVEERHDKRPHLSDLRESGAIEQDADVIVFVYRDEVYYPNSQDKGVAELIVGKQRNGPTGTAKLAYIKACTRFENLAWG
jgi:replicative DNA helicase